MVRYQHLNKLRTVALSSFYNMSGWKFVNNNNAFVLKHCFAGKSNFEMNVGILMKFAVNLYMWLSWNQILILHIQPKLNFKQAKVTP